MVASVIRMVDSREQAQKKRFQWLEAKEGFYAVDTATGERKFMETGEEMFCDEHGENCHIVGTKWFYDALNAYFENEQSDVAMKHFGLLYVEDEKGVGT
jgi:hypothetical protein